MRFSVISMSRPWMRISFESGFWYCGEESRRGHMLQCIINQCITSAICLLLDTHLRYVLLCNWSTVRIGFYCNATEFNPHKFTFQGRAAEYGREASKPAQLDIGWNVFEEYIVHSKAKYGSRQAEYSRQASRPNWFAAASASSTAEPDMLLLPILLLCSATNTIAP